MQGPVYVQNAFLLLRGAVEEAVTTCPYEQGEDVFLSNVGGIDRLACLLYMQDVAIKHELKGGDEEEILKVIWVIRQIIFEQIALSVHFEMNVEVLSLPPLPQIEKALELNRRFLSGESF